jgi:hypothetical protein
MNSDLKNHGLMVCMHRQMGLSHLIFQDHQQALEA